MQSNAIYSAQLYNWSAHERFGSNFAPSTPSLGQTTSPTRASGSPWLPHRTLQTVRQSRLQMSAGPGTRAQVLPFHQPGRRPTRNGLRPRRVFPAGLRLLAELSEGPSRAGEDLQHQPRVVTASSQILTINAHGAFILIPVGPRFRWDPRRQFFAELVASRLYLAHCNSKPSNPS